LYETKTFLIKANKGNLVSDDEFQTLITSVDKTGVKLNNYIKSIGRTTVGVKK